MFRRFFTFFWILLLVLSTTAQPPSVQANLDQAGGFVRRVDQQLVLEGQPFRFGGTNNYYLMYKSQAMVDDVIDTAAASNFRVLRMWGSLDIGNQDGTNSINGKSDNIYFQYWDGTAPAYNDGTDGLQKLDYAIYKAGQAGLKLVIPFTNNWNNFGGIDQYVRWANGQYHDQFFTDPTIRQWYKNWITHLLTRTNIYTGIAYKDDPTIMTWELANEPRCLSAGAYPRSDQCTTQTLVTWADEMSTFIKSIDQNHLVSVGDEGFYCIKNATDWTENCGEGVDTLAFTRLPYIDVMSFHLYPDHWGKTAAWGTDWIKKHFQQAQDIGKPAMLGEFGLLDKSTRNPVFKEWTDTALKYGGAGALYWILSGKQDDGSLYADYDGFTVYCPTPVCTTLSNFAQSMAAGQSLVFHPVADHDAVVTEFNTPVLIKPLANDITYQSMVLDPATIDLDPQTTGLQTSVAVYGGTFTTNPDGTVSFTPGSGFNGRSVVSYTAKVKKPAIYKDWLTNTANITVMVKPSPQAPMTLFSFETGTEGWASANWQANAGTVTQSSVFHTDGSYGLQVAAADGGWFGVLPSPALNLTGRTLLKYDLQTTSAGTSTSVALQLSDGWTWCQSSWGYVNGGMTTTVETDLLNLGCSVTDLSNVKSIYIWFSGGGTFYIDNVRAE